MKICIMSLSRSINPNLMPIKHAAALSEQGHEVIVCYGGKDSYTDKNGVKFIGLKLLKHCPFRRAAVTLSYFKAAFQIHAMIYAFFDPELATAARWMKKLNAEVIYCMPADSRLDIEPRRHRNRRLEKSERKLLSCVDAVVAATPYDRVIAEKYTKKVLELQDFPVMSDGRTNRANIESKTSENHIICYVGEICAKNGILPFIDSLEEEDAINVVLAGRFESSAVKRRLLKSHGFSYVTLYENPDAAQIANALSVSNAGMFLFEEDIISEPFLPPPVLNYMNNGLPVVISSQKCFENVMSVYRCGVCVEHDDPQKIKAAVKYILKSDDVRYNMAKNGISVIKKQFNWEASSPMVGALYGAVFQARRSKRN